MLTLPFSQQAPHGIHPELQEASPWLRDVVNAGDAAMNYGIDPAMALAVAAGVPVMLRGLKMLNEFTSVWAADIKEANALKREKQRMELYGNLKEAPKNGEGPNGRPL